MAQRSSSGSGWQEHVPSQLKRLAWPVGLGLALAVYGFVLVRSAWVNDDAYITFRTIDNFVNGYGLTWNVAERVQTYTHPLWMFLLAGLYALTREPYFTSLALSAALSVATLLIVALGIARSRPAGVFAILVLSLSKAFVDYSTSGLENPLTHFLMAVFLWILLRRELDLHTFFWLCLVAALGAVDRLDTILLYAPALAYGLFRLRSVRAFGAAAAGFIPLAVWEIFSLIYYGFLFPNTAYAKLNTGIPGALLFPAGLRYFLGSFVIDPLTVSLVALGLVLAIVLRGWRAISLGLSVGLYCLYIARIGGDFMAGRFLSTPLLIVVSLAAHSRLADTRPALAWLAALAAALGLSLASPSPTLTTGPEFPQVAHQKEWALKYNLWDERETSFQCRGLLNVLFKPGLKPCPGASLGQRAHDNGDPVISESAIGALGYYAGPNVYIIDQLGLGDPLLARLPTTRTNSWMTGHFARRIPPGYEETLRSGQNVIADPSLARYYDLLRLITRGDLFDPRRLEAIWQVNTGQADPLILTSAGLKAISEQVRLTGHEPPALTAGQANTLILDWQMPDQPPFRIDTSVSLFRLDGTPVGTAHSTSGLERSGPDGSARTEHTLDIPEGTPAVYRMRVGLFSALVPRNEWIELPDDVLVKVPPPAVALPDDLHASDAALGDEIALLGYSASQDGQPVDLAAPGPGPVTVTLFWRALRRPQADYHVFIHVERGGELVAQADDSPYHGSYPTSAWDAGETVAMTLVLDIPAGEAALLFTTGMYLPDTGQRLPVTQDGQPVPDGRAVLADSRD